MRTIVPDTENWPVYEDFRSSTVQAGVITRSEGVRIASGPLRTLLNLGRGADWKIEIKFDGDSSVAIKYRKQVWSVFESQ
jgi:hypothetical protein